MAFIIFFDFSIKTVVMPDWRLLDDNGHIEKGS